ncbi:tetratricopeptide repeat protein [Hydrogenophaga sp. XSHU_21]
MKPATRKSLAALLAMSLWLPFALHAAPVDDAVSELQRDWEVIRYQTPSKEREKRFEALSTKAHDTSTAFNGRSEALVWEGIILSSWAAERGGLGALSLVKQAKAVYEKAIEIDGNALDGSAYASLGVLYHKVPGWPIGFGDKAKAETLLKKALAINPNGIDPNFFYAELLMDTNRADQAMPYLDRALAAPPRSGRQVADAGRREEIKALMARLNAR